MFKEIKKGKIHKLVILKLDRISRNTKNILDITEELEASNASLVCVKDNIDTSMSDVDNEGQSPVYYFDKKIANSLYEFIKNIDQENNFYLKYRS